MRISRGPVHLLGLLAAASASSVLLAGCGGGDPDSPSSDPSSSASESAAPTAEDLAAMHDALHEVGELIDAAGGTDYQAVVRKVRDQDPAAATTDHPRIAAAWADLQEAQTARDEAIAALGEEPATADPDIAAAYQEMVAAGEKMFTFQDGYNASMPTLLRATELCIRIFDVNVPDSPLHAIPGAFAEDWIDAHRKLARPCEQQLAELTASENVQVQEYATNVRDVIRDREELFRAQGAGEIGMDATVKRLKKINDAYVEKQEKASDFSGTLTRLSAVDEYQALDDVFEERLESSASPSPSAS